MQDRDSNKKKVINRELLQNEVLPEESIKIQLRQYIQKINRKISLLSKRIPIYFPGSLIVSNSKNHAYFYLANQGKRTFLHKDSPMVVHLAEKEYDKSLLPILNKQKKAMEQCLKVLDEKSVRFPFIDMHPAKRDLIQPLVPPPEEYARLWQEEAYAHKARTGTEPTKRGEKVRSRAEKILADFMFDRDIPYRYEEEINIPGFGAIHPDFTVLNPETGRTFYYEHFGKMDDAQYVEETRAKLKAYASIGCIEGDGLLCDYEFNGKFEIELAEQKILRFAKEVI